MDLDALNETLLHRLRLQTTPVAVKLARSADEVPRKARRPHRTLGVRITICQAFGMARRYGWTLALCADDVACTPAALCYGFLRPPADMPNPQDAVAEAFLTMGYTVDLDAQRRELASFPTRPPGEVYAVLVAPLDKAPFEPDVVLIYANPAQLVRLVMAAVYPTGERVRGEFAGIGGSCLDGVLGTLRDGRPRVILPGAGDRIFSGTQDDEVIMAVPGPQFAAIVDALGKAGHDQGIRYPPMTFLAFEPRSAAAWQHLAAFLEPAA
ncbi:MAG: DUF169 domain-containing protein [Chloroflexi bacterium]|nr:DUF169 domain-containing protein [Chloroflexota bacterium]MBU1750386.1 DUF169 domain-containing protein [Chloroflexota bacterium]MBU1880021.1 DUF169 domain-containing protein [Chloroflexota bacterium]